MASSLLALRKVDSKSTSRREGKPRNTWQPLAREGAITGTKEQNPEKGF